MYGPSQSYIDFLDKWHQVMYILAAASFIASIILLVIHKFRFSSIKTNKGKYDFLKLNQVRQYQLIFIVFSAAIFFIGNTIGDATIVKSLVYVFVRAFISLCVATLVAYVNYLILKFYYPGMLEKQLVKLRYAPRISKEGNKMRLLSEEEEDVHLDQGMQAEENVFSVDYDVWVDEKTKEVQIEKYPGYLEALKCGSCNFQTLTLENEEIVKPATREEEGVLIKHYKCTYCQSVRHTKVPIAKLIDSISEYQLPKDYVLKGQRQVKSIMIEIVSNKGDKKEFFFQNTKQASEFLENFNFDTVRES